ncbi:AsnC family transcriptional regulator [Desulfovibrio sp. OttesenSCG-928-G11]|nr:AsnC family transcriptional regulator [Desulfovibrio sp. OttesenSCG-928-G11]
MNTGAGQLDGQAATAGPDAELDGGAIDSCPDAELDAADRRILDIIQSAFPLEARPYAVIGAALGLAEEEVLDRVRRLRRRKIIRRLGANFQSAGLGFRSTLCAAKVPEDKLEAFVADVNSHTGVTHNYLRDHDYNVWFTVIAPSWEALQALLTGIEERTGIAVLNLPARRLYKIRVDFQME